jgi:surfactin synthase thioesterase subunit
VTPSEQKLWFRRFTPSPAARATLFCFPHAGGSATYYYPVSTALAPRLDVLAVQYPGRQDRRAERPAASIDELADLVHAALAPTVTGPVVLFGHSMGAIVAFEVARRLESLSGVEPLVLLASGSRAPSRVRNDGVHERDDAGIMAELRHIGGTDARVLAEPDLIGMALPPLRSDYRAIETYRRDAGVCVRTPIVVLTAVDDPRTTVEEARAWHTHTSGGGAVHLFDGGHFFPERHAARVLDLITDTVDHLLDGRRPADWDGQLRNIRGRPPQS